MTGVTFPELFQDWLTAVALDSIGFLDADPAINQKYTYSTLDLAKFELSKSSNGYVEMVQGAGAFIYLPNIEAARRVDVALGGSSDAGLRLIMLSSGGAALSNNIVPKMIQIGK